MGRGSGEISSVNAPARSGAGAEVEAREANLAAAAELQREYEELPLSDETRAQLEELFAMLQERGEEISRQARERGEVSEEARAIMQQREASGASARFHAELRLRMAKNIFEAQQRIAGS